MNRLFLLDSMALLYRAHFALIKKPIFTSGGVNTSALYGFANVLLDVLQNALGQATRPCREVENAARSRLGDRGLDR